MDEVIMCTPLGVLGFTAVLAPEFQPLLLLLVLPLFLLRLRSSTTTATTTTATTSTTIVCSVMTKTSLTCLAINLTATLSCDIQLDPKMVTQPQPFANQAAQRSSKLM